MSPTYEIGSTRITTGVLVNNDQQLTDKWGAVVERTKGRSKSIILLDGTTPYNGENDPLYEQELAVLAIVEKIIRIPIDTILEHKTSDDPSTLSFSDRSKSSISSLV